MERGPVDVMIDHWERERPDLDASSLAIIYRNPFFGAFSVSRSRIHRNTNVQHAIP